MQDRINVTKTFLPPLEEYQGILKRAWDKGWITNRGELVQELEKKLKGHLNVPNIIAMTNGTLPIQIAIKAMKLKGDIITTPFSYVATTSSILWEGCTPVFVDIDPEYLTIDEAKIEAAITPNTSAIVATHVFGNPCAVEEIAAIAEKHNLKVIYDAAHCFGVDYKGESVFTYGDVSTCSFHATKIFHTGEGGSLVCKPEWYDTLYFHHNFGHNGPDKFESIGINAKMSELQAAMGLSVLTHMEAIIEARKNTYIRYQDRFQNHPQLQILKIRPHSRQNYAYFPVIFDTEKAMLRVKSQLEAHQIFPRRYFYPSLNDLPYIAEDSCPISSEISSKVVCLPLSHDLAVTDQERIISIIEKELNAS